MAPAYQESEHHIPNPTDQTGTVETSGTAGTAESQIGNVTKVFDVAKEHDLEVAKRALDPDDTEVHESLVTLPVGAHIVHSDPDEGRERVNAAHNAVKKANRRSSRSSGRSDRSEKSEPSEPQTAGAGAQ